MQPALVRPIHMTTTLWPGSMPAICKRSPSAPAGTGDNPVRMDAETGAERWRAKVTSEVIAAPLVTPDRVVVRSNDGRTFGLDTADGTRKWVFDRGLPTLSVRGNGAHTLQRSDGKYVIVLGNSNTTNILDVGWNTSGSWESEPISTTKISSNSALLWNANMQGSTNTAASYAATLTFDH